MDDKDKGIAAFTSAALRRGNMIHHISLFLSAFVLAQVFFKGVIISICPATVLILGLAEFWFALRVAIDADLFEKIADGQLDTRQLDEDLLQLGLIKKEKTGRDMQDRSRGAFPSSETAGDMPVFAGCCVFRSGNF